MKRWFAIGIASCALACPEAAWALTVTTDVLAPLAGRMYTPSKPYMPPIAATPLNFYGADLGLTYKHRGQLRILFGDTWVNPAGDALGGLNSTSSDSSGWICLESEPSGPCSSGAPIFPSGNQASWYSAGSNHYGWYNFQNANLGNPSYATQISWQRAAPPINFFVNGSNSLLPFNVTNNSQFRSMGAWQVPAAGFSNWPHSATPPSTAPHSGKATSFVIFNRSEFITCSNDSQCPQSNAGQPTFKCDLSMGTRPIPAFPTVLQPCIKCLDPVNDPTHCSLNVINDGGCSQAAAGLCVDTGSSVYDGGGSGSATVAGFEGRRLAAVQKMEVGNAIINGTTESPTQFVSREWRTNRFTNPVVRTVEKFKPGNAAGTPLPGDAAGHDYRPANDASTALTNTGDEKVLLWGHPGFIGNKRKNHPVKLYFAYVNMPGYSATGQFNWNVQYFTGTEAGTGKPLFSSSELAAKPLKFDNGATEIDPYDAISGTTISWVPGLNKWVMLYGGDLFAGSHGLVTMLYGIEAGVYPGDNAFGPQNWELLSFNPLGSIMIRTADHPWGPWSTLQNLFPKDASQNFANSGREDPRRFAGCESAPGNAGKCVHHEDIFNAVPVSSFGFYYSPNIIDVWTLPQTSPPAAHILWNVSTWDPYQVTLMHSYLQL